MMCYIFLNPFLRDSQGWGRAHGEYVRSQLQKFLDGGAPETTSFWISLKGVERLDVSFARAALVELAEAYRGRHVFCFVDANDADLMDNLAAAAWMRRQPFYVWNESGVYTLLGPRIPAHLFSVINYVVRSSPVCTSDVAKAFSLKIPNAGNKLKQLWEDGYLSRRERSAESGGVEYEYYAVV